MKWRFPVTKGRFFVVLNLLKRAFLSGIPGILSGVGFSDVKF